MLVYLVRQFTFDQVNHVAYHKNPKKAVKLDEQISKNLGIGNSTGLGMAPFIVNHPTLLNNWILSREIALKKIREIKDVKKNDSALFVDCVKKSITNILVEHEICDTFRMRNRMVSISHELRPILILMTYFITFKITAILA